MRPISDQRRYIEDERHRHIVRRGIRGSLHFENIPWLERVLAFLLKVTMTEAWGRANALNIKPSHVDLAVPLLPPAFEGCRLLFMTDLHIDANASLTDRLIHTIAHMDCDYIVLGGDYTFKMNCDSQRASDLMRRLARYLTGRARVFGILGNHDRYSMAECLAACGVEMLVNEHICLQRGDDRLYIAGLDDWHYFHADDLECADQGIPEHVCKIMVCHSPERYKEAALKGYSLYLAGHTHGGQVCLPGGIVLVTSATIPRKMIKGPWLYRHMAGYTSRGVGSSGVPVRFFCAPEIILMTLKRGSTPKDL